MSDVIVEVEEPLGPGLDFERDGHHGLIAARARPHGEWRGLDRGALLDTDDGHGTRLAALVAIPTSTWAGSLLAVELLGGWRTRHRTVLLATVPGADPPEPGAALAVGRLGTGAAWFEAAEATHEYARARQRFRERRSRARVLGGRAWLPDRPTRLEDRRFSTPHSAAEYSLRRLPSRYLRGLEGILDDDERLVYAIERPEVRDGRLFARLRGKDRRAALLALTDRQLVWAVDHAQPDRFLSDWGVDIELVPLERVRGVSMLPGAASRTLAVRAGPVERRYPIPAELGAEVEVMAALLARFSPDGAAGMPMRRYPLAAVPFEDDWADRFGQLELARELFARATIEQPLGYAYSPRREDRPQAGAAVLGQDVIALIGEHDHRSVPLAAVGMLRCTVSALIGRLGVETAEGPLELSYPAPLAGMGNAFLRLTRRAAANAVEVEVERPEPS